MDPGRLNAEQSRRHRKGNHHPGGCDDVGEAPFHQPVLRLERHLQRPIQLFGFAVIDEQSNQVKEAREPNHHSHNVERFKPEISLRWPGPGQGAHSE